MEPEREGEGVGRRGRRGEEGDTAGEWEGRKEAETARRREERRGRRGVGDRHRDGAGIGKKVRGRGGRDDEGVWR